MLIPSVLLLASLSAAPVVSPPPPAPGLTPAKKDSGVDAIALPLVSFSSDTGFGYGGVGGMYLYAPGKVPYAHAIGAQVFFSSAGVQSHYIRYDGPQLIGQLRLEGRLEYRREMRSPYFGAGNQSAPDFRGDESDPRYNFNKGAPGFWVRLRGRPFGPTHPLQSYVGYGWRHTSVDTYEASMLLKEKPVGFEGGSTGQLLAGVLWDTRDDESDPTEGGVEELALRVSGVGTGSRYHYAGITLSERRYLRLTSRLTLAHRVTLDMLFGDVPFYEWSNTGGVNVSEGIGGMSSVRGIERNRFSGNIKAFSNTELRFQAAQLQVFGQSMKLGAVMFMDFGRVWHPGVSDGKWYEWHPGIGGGVRLARRAAVVRMDYARSTETGRQRFYLTFGHMF
ncbi:BamA/TamA family outer membrane protein [Pyxidicoccus fallax]|uniref:BamA/TamA family outer membrane protein n=1 Tax=Pyxidicoccus fallax TaxID=394095 RepID=A0A848LJH6_9BACT|nr:BamA/TamA family outer membrane protein [Pyxidicoccus fallax]NMO17905.1 BamA/TamA family outer membrane protein [Pyxidicoccus fallax]NPC79741.1 BamA/TamA family outer membrane protein [Pyxidicoccus fallax]